MKKINKYRHGPQVIFHPLIKEKIIIIGQRVADDLKLAFPFLRSGQ